MLSREYQWKQPNASGLMLHLHSLTHGADVAGLQLLRYAGDDGSKGCPAGHQGVPVLLHHQTHKRLDITSQRLQPALGLDTVRESMHATGEVQDSLDRR